MNTAEPSPPDPKATAIAAHVAAQRPSDVVVLFGSRSRGDHRSDSDIDIMVVYDTIEHPDAPNIVSSHSKKVAADAYLVSPRIDFLWVPTALFNFWSHTINHPIARALEEGTIIQGNLKTLQPAHRDNEPYHTQQLLDQAYDQAAIAKGHIRNGDISLQRSRTGAPLQTRHHLRAEFLIFPIRDQVSNRNPITPAAGSSRTYHPSIQLPHSFRPEIPERRPRFDACSNCVSF